MQKQRQSTPFITSRDFLKLIFTSSQQWNKESGFDAFCTYLHKHIFNNLGHVFAEIYFPASDDGTFLPYTLTSEKVSRERASHIPSHLDLQEPSLATLVNQFTSVVFIDSVEIPSFFINTGNRSNALFPIVLDNSTAAILYVGSPAPIPFPDDYLLGLQTLAGTINSWMKSLKDISHLQSSMTSLEYSEQLRRVLYEINEQAHLVSTTEELYTSLHNIVGQLINARNFLLP